MGEGVSLPTLFLSGEVGVERAPDWFERRLRDEFQGRIRVRWSNQRGCFLAEQKEYVGPAPGFKEVAPDDDEAIRQRDGYTLLMEVWPGTSIPCPRCGFECRGAQPRKYQQLECLFCKVAGKADRTFQAAVFYLDEGLLEELRGLDYISHNAVDPKERVRRAHQRNLAHWAKKEQRVKDERVEWTRDHWRQLLGVPRVGWTPGMGR